MASLSEDQRLRLLENVWKSRAVLSAWNRYCTRTLVWPFLPVIPIAIYAAIEKMSTLRFLLIIFPIIAVGQFTLRRYYMQKFMSVFRSEVLAQLP
jgi:hypothetical protein